MLSNYKLKSEVLQDGTFKAYKDFTKSIYLINKSISENNIFDGDILKYRDSYCAHLQSLLNSDIKFKECERIDRAHLQRVLRLKKRNSSIIKTGVAEFLTLTFDNTTLQNTTPETRRRYISRVLKAYAVYFIANIDFGAKREREHYHAVVFPRDLSVPLNWSYGFFKVEKIKTGDKDVSAVSKYISKLTNHAIKNTTQNNRMIYSRMSSNERRNFFAMINA